MKTGNTEEGLETQMEHVEGNGLGFLVRGKERQKAVRGRTVAVYVKGTQVCALELLARGWKTSEQGVVSTVFDLFATRVSCDTPESRESIEKMMASAAHVVSGKIDKTQRQEGGSGER